MKKFLKQLTILSMAVCCLLALVSCYKPASKFAGEYVLSGEQNEIEYYCPYQNELDGGYVSDERAPNEMKSDTNLVKAINDCISMVGTKVKLTAKDVLFCDSDTKFKVKNYIFNGKSKNQNYGLYEITTKTEKLFIVVEAGKNSGMKLNDNMIIISVNKYVTAVDGKEYRCYVGIRLIKGERK